MDEKIDIVNIRLSSQLLEKIDALVDQGLYSSRSEVIRDMCRRYVLEERSKHA